MYKSLVAIVIFLCASSAEAQQPITQIAGIPVHCIAPNGVPVVGVFDESLNDVGRASYFGQQPIIQMNPIILQQLPPIAQLFFYAHECGHHVSGDIIKGYTHGFVDPTIELRADMIGIRMVRDQMHPPQQLLLQLDQVIRSNPAWDATHLPGPMRAQWIQTCYSTNAPNCQ
jgi:hypothetical protein